MRRLPMRRLPVRRQWRAFKTSILRIGQPTKHEKMVGPAGLEPATNPL